MSDALGRLSTALADRYTIERELGAGGMATVYLAHDQKHDRRVALKVLRPELAAILGGERFLAEIRTTANLQHPHVLPLHDSGEADGIVFYVMPYVEGESLRDRLTREKQLPVEEAVRIACEVADALDYAHRHGVIHRDIKPENILLHDEHVQVADFGIALAVSTAGGATRMTETGMSLGTPHYMAPEQAKGQPVDGRADQYSLGVVGYRMITGALPFGGDSIHTILYKHIFEEPPAVRSVRPDAPEALSAAIQRAMSKEPGQRFASMEEFATAVFPEQPVSARTGGPVTPKPITRAPVTAESPTEAFVSAPTTPIPSARPAPGTGPARPGPRPGPQKSGSKAWIGIAAAIVVLGGGGYLMFGRSKAPATDGGAAATQTPGNPGTANPAATPADTHTAVVTPPVTPPTSPQPAPTQHKPAPAPRRNTPAPKPAPASTGFVSIATDPIATVYIDNQSVGPSPVIGHEVPAGTHTIRVERVGYTTQTVTVQVSPGETVVRRLTLIQGG